VRDGGESPERVLEEAISQALRDNLTPLQRTADDLHQACADFAAACGSAKPSNALPALLRAQTAASSLASGLSVLTNFLLGAMKPAGLRMVVPAATAVADAEPKTAAAQPGASARVADREEESEWAEEVPQVPVAYTEELPLETESEGHQVEAESIEPLVMHETLAETSFETAVPAGVGSSEPAFDLTSFPADIQELHRRANRVAKVAMQDIKLLRPKDVQLGRENKDICERLRSELDKARKEYDRRFRAIQDHPVDYFHRWVVEILAGGNAEALGEYPYPSPVLRH